jgi:predicted N-acetyltransferase YhbS
MTIPATYRADPPAGVIIVREDGNGAIELAMQRFPHWVDEVSRAIDRGGCFVARAEGDTIGFACHSVNRRGWIGPMATDPERQRGGVGNALLSGACADLEAQGFTAGEISWVGPIGFYAKAGATVSRVFRNARLTL